MIVSMRVLGIEVIGNAIRRHGDVAASLGSWLKVAQNANWANLAEIRRTWRDTDAVGGKTIFNIKGNKYRLISTVVYPTRTIVVNELLTHAEYSKRKFR